MTPLKLNVAICGFPYGGTGGTAQEVPAVGHWRVQAAKSAKRDERIGWLKFFDMSDTPITMTRNAAVLQARHMDADVLVMVDSDMHPDLYLGRDQMCKPFFESSFDYLYERHNQNEPIVVGAPYCGPPPNEWVYVFKWSNQESEHPNPDMQLKMFEREEAARMCGIGEVAALPTGLCMFDMKLFEMTDPQIEYNAMLAQGMAREEAQALTRPWFYYEWNDVYQAQKASTEDVTSTRDMGLIVQQKFGYNPLHCNWDAWAGHYKPKCVGRPVPIFSDGVNRKYHAAVSTGKQSDLKIMNVSPDGNNFIKAGA